METAKKREILELLEADARLHTDRIATMVGETPAAVAEVIAAFEAQGVIRRYATLVDWEKAGAERVTAVINVKIAPQRGTGFDRLAQRIARFPEVRHCYLISGAHDLSVVVEAPSLKAVSDFVSERLSTIDGVSSTGTHFVMRTYKHDGVIYNDEATADERLAVTP